LVLQGQRLTALRQRLGQAIERQIESHQGRLATLAGKLDALSPLKVLERGYAIVQLEKSGELLHSPEQADVDDILLLRILRGELYARVVQRKQLK
jgi:exodeoxyribonuclease VII large subunit